MGSILFALSISTASLRASEPAAATEPAEGAPAVWPQWRGPTRDGKVTGPDWPATLQGGAISQLWRVELGEGYSSPIVATDRVFSVETKGDDEIARALDRKSGKELWEARWKGSMRVPFFASRNGSWVRATPAWDGRSLFVAGMRDVLICLDAGNGRERWRVDFMQRFKAPLPAFGFVSSPLVLGDALYVQAGGGLVKLNKETGETMWRALEDGGAMSGSAFSSPMMARIRGRDELVVQTRARLAGVAPDNGKVLWSQDVPAFQGMNILNPTVFADGVFTASYGGSAHLYNIEGDNGGSKVTEAWKAAVQGYMSTPVVIDGYAYLHRRDGKLSCIELQTGRIAWTSEQHYGDYWSMASNGHTVLALDQRGTLYLLRADPAKMQVLDSRKISDAETWAHVTVCGDEVFIRELKAMAAYRWR